MAQRWDEWGLVFNDERLSVVNAGFGLSYQLAYDALGRCVKRTVNGP